MKYIIVLKQNGFLEKYFYTIDETFEKIPRNILETLSEGYIFDTYHEAKNFAENAKFEINGEEIEAFPSSVSLFEKYTLSIRSIMVKKPQKIYFEKIDVKTAIETGDDNHHNSLVVDHNGKVSLLKRNGQGLNGNFAVTNGEVFNAGNGYVGKKAAEDDKFIENEYKRLLEAWSAYILSQGKFIVGEDFYDNSINVSELKKEIREFLEQNYS